MIGNCQVAALVDRVASIVWACLPRPDGDPIFCSLLTRDPPQAQKGSFAIEVLDLIDSGQAYVRNTAVLETTLHDSRGGAVTVTDFCPRFRARGRVHRPMMFVRIIAPLSGRPVIRVRLRPSKSYGAQHSPPRCGSHSIRFSADAVDFRVTTDASLSAVTEERLIGLDRPLVFILGPDETIDEAPAILAQSLLAQTLSYWQDWVRTLAIPYRLAGGRDSRRNHAEALYLRGHRCGAGRADDVDSGSAGQRAQLGLPLLLAA